MGAVANQLQDQNPGQKSPDYGQYGQHGQAKGPAMSPYTMNSNANDNKRQNDYNQAVGNPDPRLPANLSLGQNHHWHPGEYPSTQPQFGTNPYSPQTANLAGHPGHNPSTLQNIEPDNNPGALTQEGQFVAKMASGGTFTDSARRWNGPVSVNAPNSQNNPADAMFSMKGLGQPGRVSPTQQNGIQGFGTVPGLMGVMGQNNPEFMKAMGKGPAQPTQAVQPAPVNIPQVNPNAHIYKPAYDVNLRG